LCTAEQLEDVVAGARGRRGARALSWALDRVRAPVDSPKETQLRLGLIRCGLPEPEVQIAVWTSQGWRHADLGYPHAKQLIEYQGDEHRVSRSRWRADLTRVQLLQDAGWRVLLVGADDVDDVVAGHRAEGFGPDPGPGLRALADRIRRALDGRTFG
jgi:hypothetical protein